ncbi:hypothetical protein NHJ13051_005449, partial [Beauveria bassiana]
MSSAPKSILHLHFSPRRPLPGILLTVIPDSRVQDGTVKHEIGVPYVNMEPRDDVVYKQEQTVQELPFPLAVHQSRRPCRRTRPPTRITITVTGCVLPSAPMADRNHDASTPCSSTTSTSSLDRKTQPVVVQLTRVAAAAAASSTQAAGDFSSYLALKWPLFVDLEGDFGGSYSRHASVAESDSDKHGAEDDSGRGGGMATATRIRHRRRTRTRTRKTRSIWRRRKQRCLL